MEFIPSGYGMAVKLGYPDGETQTTRTLNGFNLREPNADASAQTNNPADWPVINERLNAQKVKDFADALVDMTNNTLVQVTMIKRQVV